MIHSIKKDGSTYAIQLGKPDIDLDTGKAVTTPAGMPTYTVASLKELLRNRKDQIASFQQTYDAELEYLKRIESDHGDVEATDAIAELEAK